MWRVFPFLQLPFAAIGCTFLNYGPLGNAHDNLGAELLPQPRLVDAPLLGGAVRLAISFDGKRLAVAGTAERVTLVGQQRVKKQDAVAYLCEADTGKQIALLELEDQQNYGGWRQIDLAFSPNGKSLATISAATVQLWDPVTGREQLTLTKPVDRVGEGHLSFSPNGNLLAVSRGDPALEIWDVAARKKSLTLSVGSQSASAFLDDESLLTAESNNRVHLWKLANGEQLGELHAMLGILHSVEISHNRQLAAVAGVDGFKVLEISSEDPRLRERSVPSARRRIQRAQPQIGQGGSVSFASKQNLLATAGAEGTVRLSDPQNGMLLGLLWWPEPSDRNAAAVLSPDGKFVVVSRCLQSAVSPNQNRVTEIYPVAELTNPDHVTRVVLAAVESLFRVIEQVGERRRLEERMVFSAMSALHGAHAEPAVPLLIEKLKSEHVRVRGTALRVLAGIGPGANQAVPAIRALSGDTSQEVQRAAQFAIAEIEGR